MRRRLFISAVLLSISAYVFSQGLDITVKPRLEGAYNSAYNQEGKEFGLGMSSLYTFLDGSITDNLSYYASLHFLNSDPKGLYNYDNPCMYGTWVDMAYLSYNRDFWGIDLGKVFMNLGGMSNEYDDVDVYSGLVPFNWNEFTTYQYGLTLRLTPWENHSFEGQFTTSPYNDPEVSSKLLYGCGICWRGEMGQFSTSWAVNGFNSWSDDDDPVKETNINIGLGNKYEFNDRWNIEFDAYLHAFNCDFANLEYSDFNLTGAFNPGENLTLKALAGLRGTKAWVFGGLCEYYPVENLRLHAALSYCDTDKLPEGYLAYHSNSFEASIGVTYTLDFHIGR